MLGKWFSLVLSVAQSLHKKSSHRTLGLAHLLKKQAATPLHNAPNFPAEQSSIDVFGKA